MAQDSALNREDITSKDVAAGIEKLNSELLQTDKQLDDIISKGKESSAILNMAKTLKAVTAEVKKLQDSNKKLQDTNKTLTESLKKLKKQQEENKKAIKDQAEASALLDDRTGGLITKMQTLGKQLAALAKSPWLLALTVIAALLAAVSSAASSYYNINASGEEKLKEREATWDSFFITLKRGWAEVGKSVDDFFGDNGLKGFFTAFLTVFAPSLVGTFLATENKAQELAKEISKLWKDHIRDVVDDANTELRVNQLLEDSKNKLKFSDEDRLKSLRQANKLLSDQLQGDIELAKDDVKAQQLLIEKLGGKVFYGKLIKDLSDKEILQMNVKQEEVEKLGHLEAALLKVQSDASLKRKANLKAEIALVQEIRREEEAFIKELIEMAKNVTEERLKEAEKEYKGVVEFNKLRTINILNNESLTSKEKAERIKKTEEDLAYLKREYDKQALEDQITFLNESLSLFSLNAEEEKAVKEKIANAQFALTDLIYNETVASNKDDIDLANATAKSIQNIYQNLYYAISSIFQQSSDARLAELDRQEQAISDSSERQLNMAGDNEKRKSKIQNDAAKRLADLETKRLKEQRRAAIFEKATGLIQAGINVALAATNQGAKGDPYTAFARVAAIIAALTPFIAVIAAKQIPQYAKGTGENGTTSPVVIAGEKGSELYVTPNNKAGLTPDSATVMNLPVGTKIYNHADTLKMLADRSMAMGENKISDNAHLIDVLINSNRSLENTIKNKKEVSYNWTKKGLEKAFQNGNSKTFFLNNFYN